MAAGDVFDPYEDLNRKVHGFNRVVDKALYRPASKGYVAVIPNPVQNGVANFADNLGNPSHAIDYILQGNLKMAGVAVARFGLNSTIGILGLGDPATAIGLPAADTDFGKTLGVWGVPEGAYQELPLFGPSTERATVGLVVALFTNPVSFTLTRPLNNTRFVAEVFSRLGDRGTYSDTVDSILYESADSYAQSRLMYLQNNRFELRRDQGPASGEPSTGIDTDPYADPYLDDYDDPYNDPYDDPYEDPYAN
jgi:phospholipid-binding lipoprotein MlaA